MSKECPFGGDNTDCPSCAYYPEYQWNKKKQDCLGMYDDQYSAYLQQWYKDHATAEHAGMQPASYAEWYNNERIEEE